MPSTDQKVPLPGAGAATPGLGGRGCSGPAPRGRGRVRGPRRASQKSTGKLSSAFIFLNVTSFTMEMRVLIFRTHVSSVGSGCLLLILENEQHTEKKQRQESPGGPEARGRRRKRRNHEPPPSRHRERVPARRCQQRLSGSRAARTLLTILTSAVPCVLPAPDRNQWIRGGGTPRSSVFSTGRRRGPSKGRRKGHSTQKPRGLIPLDPKSRQTLL